MAGRRVALLGATGSIGRQALEVIAASPELELCALASGSTPLDDLAVRDGIEHTQVGGDLTELLEASQPDLVLNAVVGFAGVGATLWALERGVTLALANKESLVAAGDLALAAWKRGGGLLLPVDSEHSAVYQAIDGRRGDEILRILLTASGGPFRSHTVARMRSATVAQALGHPTWRMGAKISVDSATLMNKGLEVIEATWLFGLPASRIDVVIHPQSVVHSMVEFRDGSMMAQMGVPDMRIPIGYALSHPGRLPLELSRLRPHRMEGLTFERPDRKRFPALRIAYSAAETGGSAPAVMSGANEEAVLAFLSGRIAFTDIVRVVDRVLSAWAAPFTARSLQEILAADAQARREARNELSRHRRHRPS